MPIRNQKTQETQLSYKEKRENGSHTLPLSHRSTEEIPSGGTLEVHGSFDYLLKSRCLIFQGSENMTVFLMFTVWRKIIQVSSHNTQEMKNYSLILLLILDL